MGSLSELMARCGEKAYNFAFRLAGNEHDARDLVQEAFVRAVTHYGGYDKGRPFESWLFTIMRNIYLDEVRRFSHGHSISLDAPMAREERPWEEILPSSELEPAASLVQRESDEVLQKALDSLAVHYRTALTLCDIEGFSYEEIGTIMACPVGTVRSRISEGRRLFRKAYEELERGAGRFN